MLTTKDYCKYIYAISDTLNLSNPVESFKIFLKILLKGTSGYKHLIFVYKLPMSFVYKLRCHSYRYLIFVNFNNPSK